MIASPHTSNKSASWRGGLSFGRVGSIILAPSSSFHGVSFVLGYFEIASGGVGLLLGQCRSLDGEQVWLHWFLPWGVRVYGKALAGVQDGANSWYFHRSSSKRIYHVSSIKSCCKC